MIRERGTLQSHGEKLQVRLYECMDECKIRIVSFYQRIYIDDEYNSTPLVRLVIMMLLSLRK